MGLVKFIESCGKDKLENVYKKKNETQTNPNWKLSKYLIMFWIFNSFGIYTLKRSPNLNTPVYKVY